MSYALLSDDLLLQLEGAGVSRDARLLYVEGIVYAATALTDGVIAVRLTKISDADDVEDCAEELVEVGLWSQVGNAYLINDYLDHQQSADEVRRKRADARLRAERSRRHKRGDHSLCVKGSYCPQGAYRGSSHADDAHGARDVTRDVRSPIQSFPFLTKGKERNKPSGSDAAATLRASASSPQEAEPDDLEPAILKLTAREDLLTLETLAALKETLARYPGTAGVHLQVKSERGTDRLDLPHKVSAETPLFDELKQLLGGECLS